MIATTAKAVHWQIDVVNFEPTKLKDGVSIRSIDNSRNSSSDGADLAKSGTAWVRTYHKPPGTDIATIYNSDVSRTDNWDPVKNPYFSNSAATEDNSFSISKKPAAFVKYGTKTNVMTPASVPNAQLTNYQKIGTKETSYSTLVTSKEIKNQNHKDVLWTATPSKRNRDWSLKMTAIQDEQQVNTDYDSSLAQNDTTSTEPMVERRETNDESSAAEYNDQSEASVEDVKVDPQDWRVVDEDGIDGWKILGRKGNVEWEIKLQNGSWTVMNQDGVFSHKVDLSIPLNDSAFENDYHTDYGNYYDETDYNIPDTGDIYLVPNYDDAWPKVTNIAVPEPWRPEDPHNDQEFLEIWPQIFNTTSKSNNYDETTTITQIPITETMMMKTTSRPKLTTPFTVTKMSNVVNNVPRYYNLGKYNSVSKGSPKREIKRYPTSEVIWTPLTEMSTPATTDLNESIKQKPNIPMPNKNNNAYRIDVSKKSIRNGNQDPKKTQSQWTTGYGSQTWTAGTGKKEWDSINSTADDSGNKISAWGTKYGTKVWRGNEWNSNVVWKTEYDQGSWNTENGTGTFVFPSSTYYGAEKIQGKGNYNGKNISPETKTPSTQSKKNYISADKNVIIVQKDNLSINNQDVPNNQQEEWGDEKSTGGVIWQKDSNLPISGSRWKFPDDAIADSVDNEKPRDKTNNAKIWAAKWSKTPVTVNGPGWKPSIVLSDKNGWKPSGTDTGNWKISKKEDDKQSTSPHTDQTSIEESAKNLELPNIGSNAALENTQDYKPNNSQYWKIAPENYKSDGWELYRDYNLPKSSWKTSGKSWKPPIFVWPEYDQETTTTTIAPISDLSEQMPTVTYSLEPNPIYIKWRKPTPSSFKWPVATPASEKWTKSSTKKWRKPTMIPVIETTSASTAQTPATSPKTSSRFPEIRYIWPIKTFNAKSWKPLDIISPSDCKDKETTTPPTTPITVMMEVTTTELPMIRKSNNDDKDKSNLEHPPIIIIKKNPGFKNIKLSGKGKGRLKFKPFPPNFYEWGKYKGQPLKISSNVVKGYYKGTPFKSISATKSKNQKKRVKAPKRIKSSYKGSAGSPIGWSQMKSNYAKWVALNPAKNQNLRPVSYTKPKRTWKDTFKKIFGLSLYSSKKNN